MQMSKLILELGEKIFIVFIDFVPIFTIFSASKVVFIHALTTYNVCRMNQDF